MKIKSTTKAFKKGMIILFDGTVGTMPKGWAWCNGNNGTPDLRDRFVIGTGANYVTGETGGSIAHSHTGSPASHYHTIRSGAQIAAGNDFEDQAVTVAGGGSTDSNDALPPYYALGYIMKL